MSDQIDYAAAISRSALNAAVEKGHPDNDFDNERNSSALVLRVDFKFAATEDQGLLLDRALEAAEAFVKPILTSMSFKEVWLSAISNEDRETGSVTVTARHRWLDLRDDKVVLEIMKKIRDRSTHFFSHQAHQHDLSFVRTSDAYDQENQHCALITFELRQKPYDLTLLAYEEIYAPMY